MSDKGLREAKGDVVQGHPVDDASGGHLERVVSGFVGVGHSPVTNFPRPGQVGGVISTDEGGPLLGHTVLPCCVPEACSRPHISVGEATPHRAQAEGPMSLAVGLEVYSRRLWSVLLWRLGLVFGLLALFQLNDAILEVLPESLIEASDRILD